MKIKVGDLRRIIREVAEEAVSAAPSASGDALYGAIDDLAATWNEWSATVTSPTGFRKYGPAASHVDSVRVLRKDQGTDKWGPQYEETAAADAEAAEWIAAADRLPWPSDDDALKVAIMRRWVEDYTGTKGRNVKGDAEYIKAAGLELPEPAVLVKPAISDIQFAGGEWMRLMLGVKSADLWSAQAKITAAYKASAAKAPRRRGK